ncbi:MAG: translocation/assembly module TamB domain-containing protein [Nitrospirota bacterium]
MKNAKGLRRVLYLLFFTIVIGLIIFVSRGPHISNALKRLILPELEAAFGQRVIAQKIYINIFPLFIEAKGLKVFDEDGNRILFANRLKGYMELSGVLSRHLSIRRLVVKEPEITTDREQLDAVIKNVKAYLEKDRKPALKVRIKVIEVIDGVASFRDDDLKGMIGLKRLGGEVIVGENPRLKATVKEFDLKREGWPELRGDLSTAMIFRKDGVEIKSLEVGAYGSKFKTEGFYSEGEGTLSTEIALLVDSVKRIFSLKQRGEGRISAKGEIKAQSSKLKAQSWKDIFIDLKLKGDFYFQTLMELLNVKERVEGFIDFQGEMKGQLSNISGKAKARLQKGNLFDVDIDSLRCEVTYHDGVMVFKNGAAELYSGKAQAEGSLNLPAAEFFTLNVKFDSIDSRAALRLIGWKPEIPAGKVDGELMTSGRKFNPDGWFIYNSHQSIVNSQSVNRLSTLDSRLSTNNVLGRIRNIKGTYSVRGGVLSLSDMKLSTAESNVSVEGTVNVAKKTINLKSRLDTNDVSDLTSPYYRGVKGRGDFSGEITGTFGNPEISGKTNIYNAFIEGYRADSITSHFSYNKNLLSVQELVLKLPDEEHRIKGKIFFPEAKELFELSEPVYEMDASITNAEFGKAIQVFYKDFLATGRLNADFKIGGRNKNIELTGNALIKKAEIYKIPFDSASVAFSYVNKELSFKQAVIKRGRSILTVEGKLSSDEKFSYRASSNRLLIKDIGLEHMPDDAILGVQSEGHGTFKNPTITLSATVVGGTFKGRPMGSGIVKAEIKNRDISLDAALFNERVKLKGNGHLDDNLPWAAEVGIQPGRYDFIVSSILKDVPEDLLLNLKGRVELKGDRRHITASANINQVTLALFGYSFSNDSDIKVQVNNRKLSFPAFTIRSGSTSFRLSGGIEIGREYDILLEGSSSLLPLKGLSKKIGHLKGDADFVFSITGKWEKPRINGGLSVSNASFGLKDYYPRISSINGYLYIDEDRIILQRLSGRLGGGEIELSGLVYLKGFGIKRFYLETHLNNITASISKDFNINFRGDLLYKGTPNSQSITGDIKINRSRYKERVEWRSLLLKAKAKERPKAEISELERAEVNIRISGSDNIYIDNNIARAPVRIDMVLRGTISRPVLFGRLESKEGSVYFRNNEFRIIHASADFADPNRINPVIEIIAGTVVKGYSIKLNLEGQMEHFNLSLSSDPPLEEMDILALLTVGQIGKQLKGLEGGIGAGEATSFLTGKMQVVLEERLRTITGFDRLQVDPYVSKTTGTVGPRVTVSKRLVGDRLFVTYTSSLGSTEEQILKLEYLLDKNISLLGIRDEKGSVGGDVKFRFEFK